MNSQSGLQYFALLKPILDEYYELYKKEYLCSDPIMFLHQFDSREDKEAAGLISALMALGNVKQIQKSLSAIFKVLKPTPYRALQRWNKIDEIIIEKNICHRFFNSYAIGAFLYAIHRVILDYGTLKTLFVPNLTSNDTLQNGLQGIRDVFYNYAFSFYAHEKKLKTLFASPRQGGACKRWLLFLRWMVRPNDCVDTGLWNEINPSALIIPVDTHVCRIAKLLRLTKKKNPSWAMAEEITKNLKNLDPLDPVKYDFALTRIGMLHRYKLQEIIRKLQSRR